MSSKFDVETLLFKVLEVVQSELPTKIAAINSEKNDNITLDVIPNNSYYNNRNEIIFSKKSFVYYCVSDLESIQTVGASSNIAVTIDFEVIFQNYANANTLQKVLRYSRALREVMQDNFKKFASTSNIEINELTPTDIQIQSEGSEFKAAGVSIKTNIAG